MPPLEKPRALLRWLLLCTLLVAASAQSARSVRDGVIEDGVPPADPQLAAALGRYQGGSESRLLGWLADGTLLVGERRRGMDQLLKLDGDAAAARAVGPPRAPLRAVSLQPFRADAIAYLGSRDAQAAGAALLLAALDGGGTRELLGPGARPGAPVWAHDGRQLAFSARLRDGQDTDLYVLDTAGATGPRLIAPGDAGEWQVLDWTSSDHALLVRHEVPNAGDELLMVDVDSGAARRVDAPGERNAGYGHIGEVRLARDGRGLYFITDRDSERAQLRLVDLYAGSSQTLTLPPGLRLEHFDASPDGRTVALAWNENGYSRVALFDREGGRLATLAQLPPGVVVALRFDERGARLAIELAASAAPRDVYVYQLAGGQLGRWTDSRLGDFDAAQLVTPQTLRFATWDRIGGQPRTLPALVYRPRGRGPWPVLLAIDGEASPLRPQLDPFVQYCVNELGIAVVAPGLRDGEAGALDLGALLAWIGSQPDLRRERVALLGRGGGGTLALGALGLYGDRLRGAIDIDGPATAAQVGAIRSPVLLVRGLAESALDAGSAEQLLWRLRSAGVASWYVAPTELEAGLATDGEVAAAQRVIAQFLQARLGG